MSAWYIKTRAEFHTTLARARALAELYARRAPTLAAFDSVRRQLQAMDEWTAAGRTPTPEEQDRITIGLIAVREVDQQLDDQTAEFHELLVQLDGYFCEWPEDEIADHSAG